MEGRKSEAFTKEIKEEKVSDISMAFNIQPSKKENQPKSINGNLRS